MTRKPTGRKRLKPTIVKTGWFSREIVLVLQEEIREVGTHYGDPTCGRDYDFTTWENATTIEGVTNDWTTD